MPIYDLNKPILYKFEKSKHIKLKNNIVSDRLRDIRNNFKIQDNILLQNYQTRKIIEDSDFYMLDQMYFRNGVIRRLIDKVGNTAAYIQKKFYSRYNLDGKLQHRTIEKSTKYKDGVDFYYKITKSIDVSYPQNQPAITTVKGRVKGKDVEKIMQKGQPTSVISTEAKSDSLNGSYKVISQKLNFAHLNKSPIKSMEMLYNENEMTQSKKILKKVVEMKDGTKLQTGQHNGQMILVKIPPQNLAQMTPEEKKVVIYKTPEAIEEILEKYDSKVKEFLA